MQRAPHHKRGQAMAEMGIVILLLVVMLFGIIEFGRMFMVANMITHAARDGARFAAVQPLSAFSGGTLSDPFVRQHVEDLICGVVTSEVCDGPTVTVTRDALPDGLGDGVSVTVSGAVPYLFGFEPWAGNGGLDFNRMVTFRAENG
jgi:Flp pilus assembly protein TadG